MTDMESNLNKLTKSYVVKCSGDQQSIVAGRQTFDRTDADLGAKQRTAWLFYRMKMSIAEITFKTKLTHDQVTDVINKNTRSETK